jgi:hypothetical protein
MRGQSKPEDTVEKPSESTHQNGLSNGIDLVSDANLCHRTTKS